MDQINPIFHYSRHLNCFLSGHIKDLLLDYFFFCKMCAFQSENPSNPSLKILSLTYIRQIEKQLKSNEERPRLLREVSTYVLISESI